jgi:hypothetical protein
LIDQNRAPSHGKGGIDKHLKWVALGLICHRAKNAQAGKCVIFARGKYDCGAAAGLFAAGLRIKREVNKITRVRTVRLAS